MGVGVSATTQRFEHVRADGHLHSIAQHSDREGHSDRKVYDMVEGL